MTHSRNRPGMAPESLRNHLALTRTRARARRGALDTGDRRDVWRSHMHSGSPAATQNLASQRHAAMHASLRSVGIEVAG